MLNNKSKTSISCIKSNAIRHEIETNFSIILKLYGGKFKNKVYRHFNLKLIRAQLF